MKRKAKQLRDWHALNAILKSKHTGGRMGDKKKAESKRKSRKQIDMRKEGY